MSAFEVASLLSKVVETEPGRKVISLKVEVGARDPEMGGARWIWMAAFPVLHLDSIAGSVRERLKEGVKKQLTTKESAPLANRSFHLSRRLCPVSGVPYSRVAVAVGIRARVCVASEVCGEGDLDPREAQSVTGRLGCPSGRHVSSGAPNTVPACLIVR